VTVVTTHRSRTSASNVALTTRLWNSYAPISTPASFRDDFRELPCLPGLCQQSSGLAVHWHSLSTAHDFENRSARFSCSDSEAGLNCASRLFLRSWTGSTGLNSASSSRSSAWPERIIGASSYIPKRSRNLTAFVLRPQFHRTNRMSSVGTKFLTFPGPTYSNTFGGSLPITCNGGGIGAPAESAPISFILRESIARMPM